MRKIANIFIPVIISIFLIPVVASADLGPKPSIHINIKNLGTDNYIIDLLTYAEKDEYYYPDSNFSNNGRTINIDEPGELDKNGITVYFDKIAKNRDITINQAKQLYNLDYNGWISANTRDSLLWGYCNGNSNHEHNFNYFGTPTRYKILIINNDTGEIKVSDEIVREDFNSYVTLDYKTMTYKTGEYYNKLLVDALTCIILTVLIELAIAFAFKTHHYVTIIITNIITNILLQFNVVLFSQRFNYLVVLLICEALVFTIEYIVYKRRFKEFDHLKTLIYTIVANAVTLILTFLLHIV